MNEALNAMADVAERKIKECGEAMGVRDPDSDEHILDSIRTGKPKITNSGGSVVINFQGTRWRGNWGTRNAEIAFINEYGRRGQRARPFMGQAMTKDERAIVDAGAEVIGDWIDKAY